MREVHVIRYYDSKNDCECILGVCFDEQLANKIKFNSNNDEDCREKGWIDFEVITTQCILPLTNVQ